jgi:hypothetical protein
MRTLVLALLIALLPVRGWVSDAMATTMGLHQAMSQMAAEAAETSTNPSSAGDVQAECGGCTTCQMCHVVALFTLPRAIPPAFVAFALPEAPHLFFIDADRARNYKPPIF